jgi:molybdopterin-biosynthesis enzyme MoeA-like protein
MGFGIIIIGDEILSGKRTDKHLAKIIELLSMRGLALSWAEYIGDDPARITDTLRRTMATKDIVFSCGGIGATPDDHTRQCAAAAMGVPLVLHPEAKEKIRERIREMALESGVEPDFDKPDNLHRLKMGEFPAGAEIIPNAFNKIPGFAIRNTLGGVHYFLPGFPVMAEPMMIWALDTHHAGLFHQFAYAEQSVIVLDGIESTLTPLMEAIEAEFSGIRVFSLPSVGDGTRRRHIELGVKGEPAMVEQAYARMLTGLDALSQDYRRS